MDLIKDMGGYKKTKDTLQQLISQDKDIVQCGKLVVVAAEIKAALLEYRRQHNIFEIKDIVFLKDQHYSEMWFITNILPDGSIELKTATHGYPVPNRCWGMYYGKAEGLQHATDDEIHSRQRKAPT